jgi:hypothetical protein
MIKAGVCAGIEGGIACWWSLVRSFFQRLSRSHATDPEVWQERSREPKPTKVRDDAF